MVGLVVGLTTLWFDYVGSRAVGEKNSSVAGVRAPAFVER